ncbi:MAG TPA: bifunctional DNA primase/polymerase, partial [Chthonomonadaceae bacterium]|nr:bifunctional DNA primase/polymerase [Chthonomonadaceae bacterium]
RLQTERSTRKEVASWWGAGYGFATIGGAISGNLCVFDIDQRDFLQRWIGAVADHDPALAERIKATFCLVETPAGGYHVRWQCQEPVGGSEDLAWAIVDIPEGAERIQKRKQCFVKIGGKERRVVAVDGQEKAVTVAIQTRAEGGYALIPGSPLACHPSRKPYKLLRGDLVRLPVLTLAEHTFLLRMAALVSDPIEKHEPATMTPKGEAARRGSDGGDRPGDLYNRSNPDVLPILLQHGWQVRRQNGEAVYLARPGKDGDGWSACWNYRGSGLLHVFSSNASPFEIPAGKTCGTYGPFQILTLLEYGGDFSACAKALAAEGYCSQRQDSPSAPMEEAEEGKATPDKTFLTLTRQLLKGLPVEVTEELRVRVEAQGWNGEAACKTLRRLWRKHKAFPIYLKLMIGQVHDLLPAGDKTAWVTDHFGKDCALLFAQWAVVSRRWALSLWEPIPWDFIEALSKLTPEKQQAYLTEWHERRRAKQRRDEDAAGKPIEYLSAREVREREGHIKPRPPSLMAVLKENLGDDACPRLLAIAMNNPQALAAWMEAQEAAQETTPSDPCADPSDDGSSIQNFEYPAISKPAKNDAESPPGIERFFPLIQTAKADGIRHSEPVLIDPVTGRKETDLGRLVRVTALDYDRAQESGDMESVADCLELLDLCQAAWERLEPEDIVTTSGWGASQEVAARGCR